MGRINLNLNNKNAKTINVMGEEIMIPTITLYHRSYIKDIEDGDRVYDLVVPLVQKITNREDMTVELFEYVTVHLLEHNKALNKLAKIEGEVFKLENMEFDYIEEVEYKGELIKFRRPKFDDRFNDLLEALNELQIDTDYDFYEMDPIFFKWAYKVLGTIKIVGSNGNVIRGLDTIIDVFINEEVSRELGGV